MITRQSHLYLYTIIDRVVQYGNIGMGQTEENALAKEGQRVGHGRRPIDGREAIDGWLEIDKEASSTYYSGQAVITYSLKDTLHKLELLT